MNSRSNPRRAANRARSLNRASAPERDDTLNYSSRPKAAGGDAHYSHGSPASVGSSGAAARSYAQRDPGETPMAPAASNATPRGMTTYRNE